VTAKRLSKQIKKLGIEAIIPVPMYDKKKKHRGYNQAEVYAKKLARELRIEYRDDIIVRARPTLPMKKLDARGRRINLKKAFNIVRNDVKFNCILIIDDIYTTGSTIDEIAHEFQMAGVENVYSLTLAIGQTT
jgi:ComF family protein